MDLRRLFRVEAFRLFDIAERFELNQAENDDEGSSDFGE